MTALVFWAVGILTVLYVWVWTRPKRVEPPKEPPVIDNRWFVFDMDTGGYFIFMERVG